MEKTHFLMLFRMLFFLKNKGKSLYSTYLDQNIVEWKVSNQSNNVTQQIHLFFIQLS